MRWLLILAAVWVGVYLFRMLTAYAVERGWLYGKGEGPTRGNAVGGLGFEQVFQPSVEHVFEEQHRLQIEADHETPGDHLVPLADSKGEGTAGRRKADGGRGQSFPPGKPEV